MWLFLSNSFLSIVDPDGSYDGSAGPKGDRLLVRARFQGDIARVFPDANVEETPDRDYRFRALIGRDRVASALFDAVMNISAANFKGSTKEKWRHDAYLGCWTVMHGEQRRQFFSERAAHRRLLDDFLPPEQPRPAGARRKR